MRIAVLLVLFAAVAVAVAAPVPTSLKKKQGSIEGYWYLTEVIENDMPTTIGSSYCRHTVIRGERYACAAQGRPTASNEEDFTVIDPDRPQLRKWQNRPAVFESDGDTLRGCFATDGRTELTECRPGKGVTYYVYTRMKE